MFINMYYIKFCPCDYNGIENQMMPIDKDDYIP